MRLFVYALFSLISFLGYAQTSISPFEEGILKKYQESIRFNENIGQWDDWILFQVEQSNSVVRFRKDGLSFSKIEESPLSDNLSDTEFKSSIGNPKKPSTILGSPQEMIQKLSSNENNPIRGHSWNLNFQNTQKDVRIQAQKEWSFKQNYFLGNKTNCDVKSHKELWYSGIYKNTDLRFYSGKNGVLEYDFILYPNSNPDKIQFNLEGVNDVRVDQNGSLNYEISLGEMEMSRPYAYQKIGDREIEIKCEYKLENGVISFEILEDYDTNFPLVIDPIIMNWSTYFDLTIPNSLPTDSNYVYSIGYASSATYPTTPGAFQTSPAGLWDLSITQFDRNTGLPTYSTFYGGNSVDVPTKSEVSGDYLYLSGYTLSNNFPVTNELQDTLAGSYDVFFLKLNIVTGLPEFSTYLGGNSWELAIDFEVENDTVYMAGYTASTDFDTTANAYQTTFGGSYDAFFVTFDILNTTIIYGTYMGGLGVDYSFDIDKNGDYAFISGITASTDFPATSGAFQTMASGSTDGFVFRYNRTSNAVDYASYIGDVGTEQSRKVVALPNGEVLIGTFIDAIEPTSFPVTPGIYHDDPPQSYTWTDNNDYVNGLYLLKLDAVGARDWSTYIGGSTMNWTQLAWMEYDGTYLYILGETFHDNWPFTANAIQTTVNPEFDLVFVKLNAQTGANAYTTLIGGSDYEDLTNGRFKIQGDRAYFTFRTDSEDYPVTYDAIQAEKLVRNKQYTSAVSVIDHVEGSLVYSSYFEGSIQPTRPPVLGVDEEGCFYLQAYTSSADYPISVGAYQTDNGGAIQMAISKVCDFCPTYSNNVLSPNSQTACANGVLDLVAGSDVENNIPDFLRDGEVQTYVFSEQYIWQISADSINWVTLPGIISTNYLPVSVTATTHFRRLKVNNATNCMDTLISNTHTVYTNGFTAPDIDPGDGYIICEGGFIQIGNAATGGTSPYIYSWTPTGSLDDPALAQPTASPISSTNYQIDVTDANMCLQRAQTLVTVLSNAAGPDVNQCNTTGIQIGTPAIPNQPSITYSWSPGTTLSDSTLAQPIANPTDTTEYILTITGPPGCPSTDTMIVNILDIDADAGPDQTICFGETATIGTPAVGDIFYGWAPGLYIDNQIDAQTTFYSGVIPNPNPYTYTLTAIDLASGCSDIDTLVMTVNQADAGKDGCGPRFIGPENGDYSNGLATFNWSVVSGDVGSLTMPNAVHPFVEPDSTTVYALAVDWNGTICRDTVIVPPCGCPIPDITPISEINCAYGGYDLTLVTTLGQDTANYSITWSPTTGLGSPNDYITTVAPTAVDITYTATVEHNFDASISCSENITVYGSATALPTALTRDTSTCPGLPVQIGFAPVAGWTYEWTPEENLSNPSIPNPIASPSTTTQYFLTVTDVVTECTADTTVVITVQEPVIDAGEDLTFCAGAIVVMGTTPVPNQTYSWTPSGGLFGANTAQPTDTLYTSITYVLEVVDTLTTCSETDTVTFTQVTPPIAEAGLPSVDLCPGGNGVQIGIAPVTGNTYVWTPTTGLSDSEISNPIANPTSTTTYTLFVTNASEGCFAQDQITVNITAGVVPTVDAGMDEEMCLSGSINLNATASESGSFEWSPTTGLSNPNIANPVATPTETTTYTVSFTNSGGCTNTDQITITVLEDPVANAGIDKTICEGASTTIGSSSQTGATYSWSPTTGLNDATISNPTASPTSTETYTVSVTMPGGCVDTDNVTVTVNALPTADAGGDMMVCSSPITIGTADGSGGVNAYAWTPVDGLDDSTTDQPMAQPGATTEYILTVTDTNGCTAMDTVIVTPGAIANAGLDKVICEGNSTIIGTTDPMDGSTFSWSPTIDLDNSFIAQPTASPTSTTQYVLTVMNGACTSSDSVNVTVLPAPSVSAGSNPFICGGACVQLGSSAVNNTTYVWSPSSSLDDATLAQPEACPTSTTTYTMIATNTLTGCQTTETATVNVTGSAPPADAGPDSTLCYGGGNVQIGSAVSGSYIYSWSPQTGLVDPFSANPTATLIAETTYTVTVTDNSTGCTNSDAVTISIGTEPILPSIHLDSICLGGSTQLGDDGVIGYSYQWTPTDSLNNPNISNPIATSSETTAYNLQVTDANGCLNTMTDTVFVQNTAAPIVDAGTDEILCQNTTLLLGTADANGGLAAYSWTPTTVLDNPTLAQPTFTPPNEFSGEVEFTITATQGICSQEEIVTITVLPEVVAEAGTPMTNCGGDIILMADAIAYGTGTWTHQSGPNIPIIANPNDTTSTVTGLDVGLHTFRWTVTGADICNSGTFDEVSIQIAEVPMLVITNPSEVCPTDLTLSSITEGSTGSGTLTYWKDLAATMTLPGPTNWSKEGTVYVKMTSLEGCTDIEPIEVICSCPKNSCNDVQISIIKRTLNQK